MIIPKDSDYRSLFVISRYFMGITADAFGKCLASRKYLIASLVSFAFMNVKERYGTFASAFILLITDILKHLYDILACHSVPREPIRSGLTRFIKLLLSGFTCVLAQPEAEEARLMLIPIIGCLCCSCGWYFSRIIL